MSKRSLIFKRAWKEHKIKLKHNCSSNFGDILRQNFLIARLIGENYKQTTYEN